jgi:hypothetical protein
MAIYVDGLGGDGQPVNEEVVKEYIDSQVQSLVNGAPAVLDTLKELGNAINNDPNFAATLLATLQSKLNVSGGIMTGPITLPAAPTLPLQAATKGYVDSVVENLPDPVLTLDGLTDVFVSDATSGQILAFNGTYWYPIDAPAGGGTTISNAAVNSSGHLIITTSSGSTIDAGYVVGATGAQGPAGADGAQGIPGETGLQGPQGIQGPAGATGATGAQGPAGVAGTDGVGITSAIVDITGNLILTKSNGSTINAGQVKGVKGDTGEAGATGATGATGAQGISVTSATVNGSGHLILTLSNGTTIDAGSSVGPAGPQGPQGEQGIEGPAGTSYTINNKTGQVQVYGVGATTQPGYDLEIDLANKANKLTTARNIALTGKVTGLASFDGSANVTMLTSLNGVSTSEISEGTNQYFTTARARSALSAGAGISYNSSTGVVSLNTNTDQVAEGANNLYFTNNRFDNRLAQSNLMALADVANVTPTTGQALVWNGNTWAPGTVSSGGGGGSSSVYKSTVRIEYDASGNLSSVSVLDGNISAVIATATSTTATVTFTFAGSTSTPLGIQVYGYQRTNNVYVTRALASDFPTRTLLGGGSSGSPTAFDAFDSSANTMTLGLTKAATGSSAAVGQTTHCIVQFILSSV